MEAFAQFVPLILIFAIMYLLLIRPQQKKAKEHQAMVAALRRGDQVVTAGGIMGKVSKVKDEREVELEIATGVNVRVVRNTITQVVSKTEPAKEYSSTDQALPFGGALCEKRLRYARYPAMETHPDLGRGSGCTGFGRSKFGL
jgi:preprotein translocase subunit YajC